MKKIAILVGIMMLVSGTVCSAAPLTDYSQGKVALDVAYSPNLQMTTAAGDWTKKGNLGFGLTCGLGNKLALQYKNSKGETGDTAGVILDATAQEFNVLYKLDKNVSAFVGMTQSKGDIKVVGVGTQSGKTMNGYQVGILGTYDLGNKFTGWASIGAGNKIAAYEVGVAYALSKDAELNLFYHDAKYKAQELEGVAGTFDVKAKGIGYGVTFKF